ncbi:MAG: NERD domain-containing protein, partial [Candidatus Marsarchaeota archaeon]|nr:NERD domain-containing protein [Candidatus Marsarchaeota archaeon]
MARMIPPVVGDETSSPGEKELFDRFVAEPGTEGWAVLHSLDIPDHRRQLMGEIDFVIAVPGLGILCLEVKSHLKVRRDREGIWYLGQDPPSRNGPFRQAADSMHSLRKYVIGRMPTLGHVMFWSAVCFTGVSFSLRSPAEWHDWQVIDAAALSGRPLRSLIGAVLVHARTFIASKPGAGWFDSNSGEPTSVQVDSLVNILRPGFEFYESPKSRRRQREDELLQFTGE